MFASTGEKLTDFDVFHPDRMAVAHPRHGRHAHPDRAGREGLRRRPGRQGGRQAHRPGRRLHPRRLPAADAGSCARWARCRRSWGCCPGWGSSASSSRTSTSARSTAIQAIIQSMTPAERANPKIIDGSRRARIARGSGTQVSDVNGLVDRFFEARKMMMSMAKGGGMPGMPGHAGRARRQAGQGQAGRRRRARPSAVSGNPAKRAAAARRPAADGAQPPAPAGAGGRTRSACRPTRDEDFDPRRQLDLPADGWRSTCK